MSVIKKYGSLIAATALTGTSTALGTLQTDDFNQLSLLIDYTTGAAETNNIISLIVEGSNDTSTWYQLPTEATASGVVTVSLREYQLTGAAAATSYKFTLEIPSCYRFLRVKASESGVVANYGTVAINYYLSSQI